MSDPDILHLDILRAEYKRIHGEVDDECKHMIQRINSITKEAVHAGKSSVQIHLVDHVKRQQPDADMMKIVLWTIRELRNRRLSVDLINQDRYTIELYGWGDRTEWLNDMNPKPLTAQQFRQRAARGRGQAAFTPGALRASTRGRGRGRGRGTFFFK